MSDLPARQQTVEFWLSKGAPKHVAEGIADRVAAESDFVPDIVGKAGELGLYQHLGSRQAALLKQPNWRNPLVQHEFAYSEVQGGDQQATRGWPAILAAGSRAEAGKLWDRYFERSKYGPGSSNPLMQRAGANQLVPGLPDLRAIADRLAANPVNVLSPGEVASSPSTPPTSVAGNLEPGSRLASAVALMALAGAGTHRFVPISYDPFKAWKATEGEVPAGVPAEAPVISVPVRTLPTPAPVAPVTYITKTGMKKVLAAPELNL